MTDHPPTDGHSTADSTDTETPMQVGDHATDQVDEPAVDDDSDRDAVVDCNEEESAEPSPTAGAPTSQIRRPWSHVATFFVLPVVVLALAVAAGFLKWEDGSTRAYQLARIESVQAAKDTTVVLLSYQPGTAEKELGAASQRLTGSFKNDYLDLIDRVVIPGAKQQLISTTASVPAAASISANADHAVVLLYVNQSTMIGSTRPTDLQSTVRVTLNKIDDRWLISEFTPE